MWVVFFEISEEEQNPDLANIEQVGEHLQEIEWKGPVPRIGEHVSLTKNIQDETIVTIWEVVGVLWKRDLFTTLKVQLGVMNPYGTMLAKRRENKP